MERIDIDTSQAEARLRSLAMEARAAAGALGVSGVGGAAGQLSGTLLTLTGAGGPVTALAIGLGVALGGAQALVRGLFDLAKTAKESAREMQKLGLVTDAEAEAAIAAGDAVERQERAYRALSVTLAAELSPAVADLAGLMTDGAAAAQDLARWLGDGSTSGSVAWAAVKTVTGLSGVITAIDALRMAVPQQAADRSGAVSDAAAKDAAERAALVAAEKELLAARMAGASVDERERLQVAAKTEEIRALVAVVEDETAATAEREVASVKLAAREEELRQIRATAERERASQSDAERKRLESEAQATLRLAEARVALMASNSGEQLSARIGASNTGALAALVSNSGGALNGRMDPGLVGADTSIAGAANAAAGDTGNAALVAAHKASAGQIAAVWTQTASTVAGALDMMSGVFSKSVAGQKAFALTSIAINTAVATMQALMSPPGPPYTIPLAAAVGAFGAIQFAAAASGKLAGGAGISAGIGGSLRDARREERQERRVSRSKLGANQRYGPSSREDSGGNVSIYAIDTRELVRQMREMGALGYSAGG